MGGRRPRMSLVLTLLVGCNASVQLMLKQPIHQQCTSAGLHGCEELTDGVLLYVEGEHDEGRKKIHLGAAKNEPEQIHAFAEKIRDLKSIPGADEYVGPLIEVAEILAPENGRARASVSSHEDPETKTSVAGPNDRQLPGARSLAGTSVPAADRKAYACQLYADAAWDPDPDASVARCVKVTSGPAILTDMQTTGMCHDLLAIGAGDPQNPRWVLVGQPSAIVAVHGARYTVSGGETLFVAQAGARADTLGRSDACMITWAAER
jgi:hypothetical protein